MKILRKEKDFGFQEPPYEKNYRESASHDGERRSLSKAAMVKPYLAVERSDYILQIVERESCLFFRLAGYLLPNFTAKKFPKYFNFSGKILAQEMFAD